LRSPIVCRSNVFIVSVRCNEAHMQNDNIDSTTNMQKHKL